MSPEVLTDRQRSVLDFLRQFLRENGYPPTIREIAAHFDMRSPRGVQDHLKALERKGYIRRAKERSRGIEVLKLGDGRENPRSNVVRLPLIGQVAAGAPVLSEENIEEWIEVDASFAAREGNFLLKVVGDSMVDAHILDGDTIVVSPQETARDGEIVVALVDDEATVKTFYKEPGGIRLQPENPRLKPIMVPAGSADVRIIGKVVAVMRVL
ncbi:MAG: transcriptional repressor LexA [Candidatus Krumholzibacteriia bacterium]|nr:transcriptional repressor LexA [bacterium]MCB9513712.1 transcriptional repressor LexA [Candidatus Latescibacterota bacterium]MCB9515408.1 transcriptional repressor LexA [Candidatus Latescibacterota bacterium]